MTVDQFRNELVEFRHLMQSREVMLDLERRDQLGRGLAWAWFHCEDANEALETAFTATLDEFHHRSMLIDLHGICHDTEVDNG